jgi:uncharacterized protein (TIGR02246 family)
MKLSRALPLFLLLLAGAAPALGAQSLQGLIQDENPANNRDAYRLRVRQEVTGLLGSWKRAWDRDNAGEAAGLYTRDGVFVTAAGDEVRGRDSLQTHLQSLLGSSGPLQYSIQDFEFSGEMAFMRGQMAYVGPGGETQPRVMETFVLIARRGRGDQWLIRSLALMPLLPAERVTGAPAPANGS